VVTFTRACQQNVHIASSPRAITPRCSTVTKQICRRETHRIPQGRYEVTLVALNSRFQLRFFSHVFKSIGIMKFPGMMDSWNYLYITTGQRFIKLINTTSEIYSNMFIFKSPFKRNFRLPRLITGWYLKLETTD
jgi:hypothetical protein